MYKFLFPKRKKFEINSADVTFKVHYLGNVVTSMMKGEGCVDKPVGVLWNNHLKHNGKSGIKMKLTLTQGGLCVSTKTSGISEYYGHRIHYIVAHELHPKLFVWVYQHVNKNLKTELRCHAVLCKRETDAKLIATLLNEKILNTFNEYKREKRRKQNARLVNAISGSLYPMRKASLRSTSKYKPPIQRGMCGAPKLDDVTEEEEEEAEEQELEQQQQQRQLNSNQTNKQQNYALTSSLCYQKSITSNHNNNNSQNINDVKTKETNNNNESSSNESFNMMTNKTINNKNNEVVLLNKVNSNRRINNENLNPNTSNSLNNRRYNNKLIKTNESNNKINENVNNNNKDNCNNNKHENLNNNNNNNNNNNVKYLVINEELINSLLYDSSDEEEEEDDHELIEEGCYVNSGTSVNSVTCSDERTEIINCKLNDINNKVSEKSNLISDNIQLSPSINSLNSNSASDSGIGESFTNLNYEFGNDIDTLKNDKSLQKAIDNLNDKLIFNTNKENNEVIIVHDEEDDDTTIGNNTITCENNNESESNSLNSTLNSDKCESNKETASASQQVSYDYLAELNNNKSIAHKPVIKQRLNSSFRFRNPFKRLQLSSSFNSYTTYQTYQDQHQQQQEEQQEQQQEDKQTKEKVEEYQKIETKTEQPAEPKPKPQMKPDIAPTKPFLKHPPKLHQTAFITKSPKHPLTTLPHITNNESIIAIVAN